MELINPETPGNQVTEGRVDLVSIFYCKLCLILQHELVQLQELLLFYQFKTEVLEFVQELGI